MAHVFSLIFFCLTQSKVLAEEDKIPVNLPNITRRCEYLNEERHKKIQLKEKIQSLIEKNQYLQKITPNQKKSVATKLTKNLGQLEHELALIKLTIENREEYLVRKGCPGIKL